MHEFAKHLDFMTSPLYNYSKRFLEEKIYYIIELQYAEAYLLCSTRFFALVNSLDLSRRLRCRVRFVFVSTLNLQRGRAFVVGIANFSKQAVSV
jgi:hypothetical protein